MVLDVPLRVWSIFQIGATGHLPLFPAPTKTNILTSWLVQISISTRQEVNLPLGQSLARGVKHTTGRSVNKTDFAA